MKEVLIIVIPILLVQWVLAIVALMRLFGDRVKSPQVILWNVFIVLGVIVGPITYILISVGKRKKASRHAETLENKGKNGEDGDLKG